KKATDADQYAPKGKDQTVEQGQTPEAKNSIENLGDLPDGTKVDFKTPVDTSTPGDKDATVVVTYPDGTTDEVPAKVTVNKKATDADQYAPKGKDQTVEQGQTLEAKNSIENLGDLPDGTTDEVPAKVTVNKKATDADQYAPKGKDQTVKNLPNTGETNQDNKELILLESIMAIVGGALFLRKRKKN
ncbi:LPXTG cell wall anchor domain-containing protein, partial [Staphylococcus aureus]|uniref:Rib/alpha-like domain-containing protein n=1 Tax=Staphylococcus aureus TaxID=1280 RepID=UPI0018EAECB3